MPASQRGPKLIQIAGEVDVLVDLLRNPLQHALSGRRSFYSVRVEAVGCLGEVLVSITGSKGRLPLLFGRGELEPGYVARVVGDNVDKYL